MKPRIVVMMSTYNGEKYLAEQLNSIVQQNVDADLTLLVRDDGSTDSTTQILHEWEKFVKIEYVRDKESLGAAKSFWKLLKNAPVADYYAFVDQDDIWDKDKLKIAIAAIGDTNELRLWFSNCRLITADGKVLKEKKHYETPILDIPSQLICGSAQGCAMVFNRSSYVFLRNLCIKTIPMHDIVTMVYILANGKVIYEPTPLFSYRVHSTNVIAKEGKSFVSRAKSTFILWFGEKDKYSISNFAGQIRYNNGKILSQVDKDYLDKLVNCRRSLHSRIYILRNEKTRTTNLAALRSFRIRVFLGIV